MPRTKQSEPKVQPAPHRVIGRASEALRAASRQVRRQVAADREQIATEAEKVVREAEAAGELESIRVLFQRSERHLLDAIDGYARKHRLTGRAQVLRAALGKLLKIEVAAPKWRSAKERVRKSARAE